VWHDLCEDDLILPTHGNEYVLKGSELFEESDSGRRGLFARFCLIWLVFFFFFFFFFLFFKIKKKFKIFLFK
jgi:hypothetical protein